MDFVGALTQKPKLLFLRFLVLSLISLLSSSQAAASGFSSFHFPDACIYPFIKEASSFTSPPPPSSSSFSPRNGDHHHHSAFDYIVVGGGTAGCPLAATLSQNFTVLLLERGGVPFSDVNVSFLQNFHMTLADTSPQSASQYFISTDGVLNARARVLGGGSSINAGFYTRASSQYRMGWDAKLVNESFPWVERQIVHQPKQEGWQKALRDSLLDVGVSPFNGFTYDHIYGTKIGGTIFDRFGRRHTAAELLASANPQKITVLIRATVQKIVFDTSGKRPKAVGVIFKDENGNQHQAFLAGNPKSEVILSCGAIGTPQMLKLSGVGPKAELEKLNISVVLDNAHIGKGMADNPMNAVFVPSNRPVEQSLIETVGITKLGVYIEASSGFGESRDSIHCHHGIMSAEAFKGGFILEKIASPISTGELSLMNTNVDDNPSVSFNYFSHPLDLKRCVDGVRMAAKIVQSKHFLNYTQCDQKSVEAILNASVRANVNLVPKHTNDTKSLEQFCKDTVITIWHYHGGCHVGKVVSTEYKVLGIDRLRVVDGSTYDESPGTNPQGTVLMMGRYMGVKILRQRLGKAAGV
ncbi:protein HOTHEAD [Citrus sinensis]|uniref:Protein HOTHEAD n=1 Tax=Citrus sinensis TaxID=2711 RepID=A0ACB8J6L7_CITSI|nr:protein HOTHEAD [Citrus sinensis]